MNVSQKMTSRRGQSLVEFALAIPLLMVVMFGAVEFGTALYDKAVITNASREGARAGIVATTPRLSNSGIHAVISGYSKTHVINYKKTAGDTATTSIVPNAVASRTSGVLMTVTVTYTYRSFLLPKFLQGFGNGFDLTASTTMRME